MNKNNKTANLQKNDIKILGKCVKCGCLTSSSRKELHIESTLHGVFIDGTWFCNLCLPCHFSFEEER